MSNVLVDTLDGMALDYACAKAQGYEFTTDTISVLAYKSDAPNKVLQVSHTGAIGYAPSRCWRIAGSIIDDVKISITHNTIHQDWVGSINLSDGVEVKCSGHRPLVAAMRAFVKSVLGDNVSVPDSVLRESKSQLEMMARVVSVRETLNPIHTEVEVGNGKTLARWHS